MRRWVAGLAMLAVVGCGSGKEAAPIATTPATAATTTSTTSTTSTTTAPRPRVGAAQQTQAGGTITVHAVEAPAHPNRQLTLAADPGMQFTALDVEVCAAATVSASTWTESEFTLQTTDNRVWEFWNVQDYARSPRFGFDSISPGACRRGWITYQTPGGQPIVHVRWSDPDSPTNALQWDA